MVRTRGQEMRRLQRKLIPVNLLVCILCIVSAVTLFFMPLLKIDLGKIVGNEEVQKIILDEVDKMGGTSTAAEEEGDSSESNGGSSMSIDVNSIVKAVLQPILSGVDGQIVLSPMEMTKFTFSQNPGTLLIETYLTGEKGLVTQLVKSLSETISNLGENKEVTDAIETVVVQAVAEAMKESLPEEFKELVEVEDLQDTIKKLGDAKTEDEAVGTIMDYMDELAVKNEGGSALNEEERANLEKSVREMYQEVVAETRNEETGEDNFSMEALICVMASKGLNESLGEGGLGSLFGGVVGGGSTDGESSVAPTRNILADGEISGGADGAGSGENGSTEGGENDAETPNGPVYTTYNELFGSLIKPEDTDKMINEITSSINGQVGNLTETIDSQKTVVMISWGVLIFFVALWVILFLFAFFHMFARNKRFTMWYVKLFAPYPCIIFWLAPTVAKLLITKGVISGLDAATVSIANALFAGISSMTWIMGICYLLLWAVSIFWAFPIKRKIRRLKREAKERDY